MGGVDNSEKKMIRLHLRKSFHLPVAQMNNIFSKLIRAITTWNITASIVGSTHDWSSFQGLELAYLFSRWKIHGNFTFLLM